MPCNIRRPNFNICRDFVGSLSVYVSWKVPSASFIVPPNSCIPPMLAVVTTSFRLRSQSLLKNRCLFKCSYSTSWKTYRKISQYCYNLMRWWASTF